MNDLKETIETTNYTAPVRPPAAEVLAVEPESNTQGSKMEKNTMLGEPWRETKTPAEAQEKVPDLQPVPRASKNVAEQLAEVAAAQEGGQQIGLDVVESEYDKNENEQPDTKRL